MSVNLWPMRVNAMDFDTQVLIYGTLAFLIYDWCQKQLKEHPWLVEGVKRDLLDAAGWLSEKSLTGDTNGHSQS